jgi:hypothetical protein
LAALLLAFCAVLGSGTAVAQTLSFSDPAGDGNEGTHLDVTAIRVANRDHVIVTTISVAKVVYGSLTVPFKQRRGPRDQASVYSSHRARGDTRTLWTAEAGHTKCKGLRVTWDASRSRVRVRVPSRCFAHGDYGAIKVRALTEVDVGTADFAPKTPEGNWSWTDWVSRG